MNDEKSIRVEEIFKSIETKFNDNKNLDRELIEKLFEELKKFSNGEKIIKEISWLFGIGEEERHIVESKECLKVFRVDFKKCWKLIINNLN